MSDIPAGWAWTDDPEGVEGWRGPFGTREEAVASVLLENAGEPAWVAQATRPDLGTAAREVAERQMECFMEQVEEALGQEHYADLPEDRGLEVSSPAAIRLLMAQVEAWAREHLVWRCFDVLDPFERVDPQ